MPGSIEGLESVTVKTLARFTQEFEIGGHGDDILVVVPLLADLEVVEDLTRHIGFQWPSDQGTEVVFRFLKIGFLRRDIEKPETIELPEESLIGRKVGYKMRWCCKARIHVSEGDHRGGP